MTKSQWRRMMETKGYIVSEFYNVMKSEFVLRADRDGECRQWQAV